jgi:hypothetical protein
MHIQCMIQRTREGEKDKATIRMLVKITEYLKNPLDKLFRDATLISFPCPIERPLRPGGNQSIRFPFSFRTYMNASGSEVNFFFLKEIHQD